MVTNKKIKKSDFFNINQISLSHPKRNNGYHHLCSEFCEHRVLLVDDCAFNLLALQSFLDEMQINYTAVNSGAEAV